MTIGKILGTIVFIISQILALYDVFIITYLIFNKLIDAKLIAEMITGLFMYEFAIFGIVWGAKSISNFAPIIPGKEETNEKKRLIV